MCKKVFLDTCIWMELCVLSNPQDFHDVIQNRKASQLLSDLLLDKDKTEIISLKYQIIELIQVILKSKMKECNKSLKAMGLPGIENIKDFRNNPRSRIYLQQALSVCQSTYEDILRMSSVIDEYAVNIPEMISFLDELDVNDSIYYEYCKKNNVDFYTFDKDFLNLDQQLVKVL